MQIKNLFTAAFCAGILSLGRIAGQAQTTATWIGPSSGGEWNTAANWSTLLAPADATTNAFIGAGTNVNYNLPMVAATFGGVTNRGTLNINASGFNCTAIVMNQPAGGGKLFINNGAAVTVTGNAGFTSNNVVTMATGSTVNINGSLYIGSGITGGSGSGTVGSSAIVTNNGATLNTLATSLNVPNASVSANCLFVINGGINNLGNVSISRGTGGNGAPPTLGTDGLVVNNGTVTITNLSTASNSHQTMDVTGGLVTNLGSFKLNQPTAQRTARFVQSGGLFVNPTTNIVNLLPTASGAITLYQVTGGTNMVAGFQFGDTVPSAGITTFTVGAPVYVGSSGTASNGAVSLTASLNTGGKLAASADWTNGVTLTLGGGIIDAEDVSGTPHNIYSAGLLRGTGALTKTGGGTLTLGAANTYSGITFVQGGTLALDVAGSLTSPQIILANGTVFDVSLASGYTLNALQTLSGFGTVNGAVAAANTATIYPGSNVVTGTLTFPGGLTENGGVVNEFNLSGTPSGPNNDFINASGGLTLSGTNTIIINGTLANGGAYPLINYGSSLTGGVTNFTVVGASGVLSNSLAAHTIYFVNLTSFRAPTNIVWIGNATANSWDVESTTNWLDNGVGTPDFFVPGDNALFSNLGATYSLVSIPVSVVPNLVIINTTSNYTFTGNGAIGGLASLTVSNGTLTVLTTNTYVGQTIFAGGVLATPLIANGGSPSGIGAASVDPSAVLFNGGTFNYFGTSAGTDHGMTFTNGGATIDVTNGTTLTLNGSLIGNGGLTLIDSGTLTLTAPNTYTGNTTVSSGTLFLNNVAAAGTGTINLSGGNLTLAAIKPANTINVAASSSINGGNAGGSTGIKNVTGSANLGLSVTTGVFDLTGDMSTYSGTITFTNAGGATVRFNGSIGSPLATWDLGAGPMDLNVRTSSSSNNIGALKGASGTTLSGRGGSGNNGSTTYYIGANNLSSEFDGIIQNGFGASGSTPSVNSPNAINKVGSGTLTLSGANTYTSATTISSGTLALIGSASISSSSSINVVSGATLDVSGLSTPTLVVGSAQTLQGRGTILGGVDSTSGLRIAPGGGVGGSVGTLTATNAIVLGGITWMKLNRASSPNSDKLVSSLSTITYGGTVVVTNIGAKLQTGDTFTLFSGGSLNAASFTSIVLPNYYTWDTTQLGVNGSVSVTGVLPSPDITSVDFSGLSGGTIVLNAVNGAANGPITVLTSTNLALPLGSWTSNSVTAFDGSGNLSNFTITVNPALPQEFITLQVQ